MHATDETFANVARKREAMTYTATLATGSCCHWYCSNPVVHEQKIALLDPFQYAVAGQVLLVARNGNE